jgi:hypothetical protein
MIGQESLSTLASDALVLQTLRITCPLTMDQLLSRLPELRWNEVFHAIDLLSRQGKITLRRRGFEYEVRLPAEISCCA